MGKAFELSSKEGKKLVKLKAFISEKVKDMVNKTKHLIFKLLYFYLNISNSEHCMFEVFRKFIAIITILCSTYYIDIRFFFVKMFQAIDSITLSFHFILVLG